MIFKHFGSRTKKEDIEVYKKSPNWKDGRFTNLVETEVAIPLSKFPTMLYRQFSGSSRRDPKINIPVEPLDLTALTKSTEKAQFVWYGHSVILMHMSGKSILIDPMFGPDTTPIAPVPTKRFSEDVLSIIDDLPMIDIVLISHDHYDHLDFESISQIKSKCKKFIVALGVKRHLVGWGVTPDIIIEMDWWETHTAEEISITFTPTRHFSGRGLTDRMKSLWGGWIINTKDENIWFSGDGGYGPHFKEIGNKYGPFDLAFMECGQYNDLWRALHLFPDESVQAGIDGMSKRLMPVHWGGFSLSFQHNWFEPVEDFVKVANEFNVNIVLPKPGQIFNVASNTLERWWEEYK